MGVRLCFFVTMCVRVSCLTFTTPSLKWLDVHLCFCVTVCVHVCVCVCVCSVYICVWVCHVLLSLLPVWNGVWRGRRKSYQSILCYSMPPYCAESNQQGEVRCALDCSSKLHILRTWQIVYSHNVFDQSLTRSIWSISYWVMLLNTVLRMQVLYTSDLFSLQGQAGKQCWIRARVFRIFSPDNSQHYSELAWCSSVHEVQTHRIRTATHHKENCCIATYQTKEAGTW